MTRKTVTKDSAHESARRAEALASVAVRREQWRAAMAGNVEAQIFLGKRYLGQSEAGAIRDDSGTN